MGNACCRQFPQDKKDSIGQITIEQLKDNHQNQNFAQLARKFSSYRTETTHLPIANPRAEENIKKLSKQNDNESKIWKVRQPYNLIYVNHDPQFKNQIPRGHVTIYKLRESGDVGGYFEGKIDEHFQPDLSESLYVYHNGSYFVGTGNNKGVYTNQNTNLKYEGGWKEQHPHGEGKQVNNKGTYEGHYLNGQKHGWGKFIWNNGAVYEGSFEKGSLNGKGTFIYSEKNYSYTGQYCQDLKHGEGTENKQYWSYQGEFYRDKKCGKGVLTIYQDQNRKQKVSTYQGIFDNNLPNGSGTYTDHSTGKKIKGFWDRGTLISLH